MKLEAILKSQILFYIILALMVINIVGYISVGSLECVIIFGLVSYGAHYFTKNNALGILAGLFIANFLFGCGRIQENFREVPTTVKVVRLQPLEPPHVDGRSGLRFPTGAGGTQYRRDTENPGAPPPSNGGESVGGGGMLTRTLCLLRGMTMRNGRCVSA